MFSSGWLHWAAPAALILSTACGSSDEAGLVNSVPGTDLQLEAADGLNHGEAVAIQAVGGAQTIDQGQNGFVRAEVVFPDEYTIDVTEQTFFSVNTPDILSIAARTEQGVPFTADAVGQGAIGLLLGNLSGVATITVEEPPPPPGLPVLGNYTHDINEVELTLIADATDGLNEPRDLEFNPVRPNELWVLNRRSGNTGALAVTGSVLVIFDPSDGAGMTMMGPINTPSGQHFLAQPSALAMGAPNTMATIHETDDLTQGPLEQGGTPRTFMGPTLYSTLLDEFDGGHGGHLDMLHNTPNGMGIAWDRDNIYWVFDGFHSSITRYNFNEDHGLGGSDHTDGEVSRYAQGQVQWVENTPSHLELDPDTNLLYIADTGNGRIGVLDTMVGSRGAPLQPNYDGTDQYRMNNTSVVTLVDGNDHGMLAPSGLALLDDLIFVSDRSTSIIWAFNKSGELVDWLETGFAPDTLAGINFDGEGNLYLVDTANDQVFRISPL